MYRREQININTYLHICIIFYYLALCNTPNKGLLCCCHVIPVSPLWLSRRYCSYRPSLKRDTCPPSQKHLRRKGRACFLIASCFLSKPTASEQCCFFVVRRCHCRCFCLPIQRFFTLNGIQQAPQEESGSVSFPREIPVPSWSQTIYPGIVLLNMYVSYHIIPYHGF